PARLCRDGGGGTRHQRSRQLQPTLGRRAGQQLVQPIAQQHPADPPCAQDRFHDRTPAAASARKRPTRAINRSTSSRIASTSSKNASSSARATTSRDSSVTYSAALPASSVATTRA